MIDIYPFVTNYHSPVFEVLSQDATNLCGVVICSVGNIPNPAVKLSAHLVELQTGIRMPLQFSIPSSAKEKEAEIFLLEFKLPDMNPGEYSVEIVAEEVISQAKSKVIKNLKIR